MTIRSVLYNELVFVKCNSTQQQDLLWNLKFCLLKAVNCTVGSRSFYTSLLLEKSWFWALQIRYSLFINNCFWVNSSTLNRVSTVEFTVSVLWRDFCGIILKKYHKSRVEKYFSAFLSWYFEEIELTLSSFATEYRTMTNECWRHYPKSIALQYFLTPCNAL